MSPVISDNCEIAGRTRPRRLPKRSAVLGIAMLLAAGVAAGQTGDSQTGDPRTGSAPSGDSGAVASAIEGLKLRGIGPALMGGRIADLAVHPERRSTWYVVVGSGGLWKTDNAGTTWKPIFDEYPSYSLGTVALDPSNPEVVWLGTGENVSGRHVGWGDGVYRSRDGGATWEAVGLDGSQHIGKILVDPRDGDTVLVAAEGPLWNGGGDRGVYRTEDGGATWTRTLDLGPDTGVTDLEFAPGDPDTVYAAAYQRRRHVWSFLAGGPGSGIHKSDDGGRSFRKITTGLPKGDVGKIGLAVTPADPRLVYATIEADEEERGFYRSTDRGESWERRNPYISGGTGPHYYQEIEASPTDPDLVYQMDVFFHVTRDGGKTFDYLGTGREKHSDNHALWIDPDDPGHLLGGTDSGLYETYDEGVTWRHFPNMPVSQFYKVALSNGEPFYDVLGGAQDLGTVHGPSRTLNLEGVRNRDWYVPLGADGYGVDIDPRDPNIMYLMTQQGNLYRADRRSEEVLHIGPVAAPGEPPERWNWDSPIFISPHNADRIYFGSQRVWRSEDRGQSWTAISGDLTTGRNRYELPFYDRIWSVDALHDTAAMSRYATLTAMTESPVTEGVLFAASDDGLVHSSADGGVNWTRAAALPDLPALSFVNDIEASQHDADTVFVVADNHKMGDFRTYLFRSRDRGASWESIAGDLPDGTIVWAIQQDHEDPDLLFLGAEFGLHVSWNGGTNWVKLKGAPTISFRDVKVQRRDDDLVGATFGRGFYVLDDYSSLRTMAAAVRSGDSVLFPLRDAWWYVPSVPAQAPGRPTQGSTAFVADNPPFGAVFTYYLAEDLKTAQQERRDTEKGTREEGGDIAFPGFDTLRIEELEADPAVFVVIRDANGEPVRRIAGPAKKGVQRVAWDLRGPAPNPVNLTTPGFSPPWVRPPQGPLTAPGEYQAQLVAVTRDGARSLGEPQRFEVRPVPNLPEGVDPAAVAAFQQETAALLRQIHGAAAEASRIRERLRHLRAALNETPRADEALFGRMDTILRTLSDLEVRLNGDPARQSRNHPAAPSIRGRVGGVASGHWETRQTPTATQRESLRIAAGEFETLRGELRTLVDEDLAQLEADLEAAGAPWTPGRKIPGR